MVTIFNFYIVYIGIFPANLVYSSTPNSAFKITNGEYVEIYFFATEILASMSRTGIIFAMTFSHLILHLAFSLQIIFSFHQDICPNTLRLDSSIPHSPLSF